MADTLPDDENNEPAEIEQEPGQEQENAAPAPHVPSPQPPQNLVDELGVADIYDPIFDKDGKLFCTAGRNAPVAEFTDDFLILHPPQMPLDESDAGEDFTLRSDERGILLNELGEPKKIPAATYKGCAIYFMVEQKPGTLKHVVAALAADGGLYAIYNEEGERLTSKDVYDLRNKSADGEISVFEEISSDLDEVEN